MSDQQFLLRRSSWLAIFGAGTALFLGGGALMIADGDVALGILVGLCGVPLALLAFHSIFRRAGFIVRDDGLEVHTLLQRWWIPWPSVKAVAVGVRRTDGIDVPIIEVELLGTRDVVRTNRWLGIGRRLEFHAHGLTQLERERLVELSEAKRLARDRQPG